MGLYMPPIPQEELTNNWLMYGLLGTVMTIISLLVLPITSPMPVWISMYMLLKWYKLYIYVEIFPDFKVC